MICSIPNCKRPHFGRGWCNTHYCRWRKHGDPNYGHMIIGENRKDNPLYPTYKQMLQRCSNPNHKYYEYYGGRGITVCEEWKGPNGFTQFLADMGQRPEGYTLDRMDGDKGYSPDNCRWATRRVQQLNRGVQSNNTSGHKGVSLHKATGRWTAHIYENGKKTHLGYFKTKEAAILARMKAELEIN